MSPSINNLLFRHSNADITLNHIIAELVVCILIFI